MSRDNLEKRVENLELALVSAMAIIQTTLPAEAEDRVWRLMDTFYSSSSTLGSGMFGEHNTIFNGENGKK